MKYRPCYIPNGHMEDTFDTEEQAWKWIVNNCKKCSTQRDARKRCYHCEAEWDVEEVPERLITNT